MGPGDGRTGAGRSAERLSRDLPPPRRRDQALRPLPAPQQDPAARRTRRRRRTFLENSSFRFDLPLVRRPDGAFVFAGTVKKRTVTAARPRVPDAAAGRRRGAARRVRVQVRGTGQRSSPRRRSSSSSRATSASATRVPDFTRRDQHGPDRLPRVHRRLAGACCSRTRPTSRRSAPPSSAPRPSCGASGASATSRSSASASTAPRTTSAGSPTSTRRSTRGSNFPIIADKDRRVSMLFGMLDADHTSATARASARP